MSEIPVPVLQESSFFDTVFAVSNDSLFAILKNMTLIKRVYCMQNDKIRQKTGFGLCFDSFGGY